MLSCFRSTSTLFLACLQAPTNRAKLAARRACIGACMFAQVDCHLLAASKAQESFDSEAVRKRSKESHLLLPLR